MTYAILQIGNHQYKVQPGDKISIQKVEALEGSEIQFSDILCVSENDQIRTDAKSAKVTGTVVAQDRGQKIRVYKKKRRKGYEKTIGHRQYYTTVEINTIEA